MHGIILRQLRIIRRSKPGCFALHSISRSDFLRQRSHHPEVALGALHPGQSDPGRHVAEHDLITQTLQSLTEKQRSALLLHEVQGFSCDEIGQLLSMSPDAVKMALFRAREQFRRTYQQAEEM